MITMPHAGKTFRYLFFFILGYWALPTNAQNTWYFGNSTSGIQFNKPNFSATLATHPAIPGYGSGGGAVVSDPVSGNLSFYTDGQNVYDINNALMPNGSGLSADNTKNQAVAVCKVPGTKSQYYIFTNTATGAIQFSIVDMSLGGTFPAPPTGQVTIKNATIPGLPIGLSEAMMVIPHANGEDFWLVAHSNTTNDFYTILVDNTGLAAPTITVTTAGLLETPSNFAYNPATKMLAVSPKVANRNIEIFKFDDTGLTPPPLTLTQTVTTSNLPTAASQAIYDTEWSANGKYLYASIYGDPGLPPIQADVVQFDLTNPTQLPTSILPQPNNILTSFGLQMGPDSAIYHLYENTAGQYFVGKITDTDSVANKVIYIPQAFTQGPASVNFFNGKQFPSFAPKDTVAIKVTFVARDTCTNSLASFFPTVTPGADSLVWDFGDGSTATEWNPTHTFAASGVFNVKVKAYLNGDTAVFKRDVTINDFQLQISLVQDTTACSSELPFPKNKSIPGCTSGCFQLTAQINGSASSTQWFGPSGILASQTSATLKPDSAGYYYVVATDASVPGCKAYAGVNIKEYGVEDLRSNIWHFGDKAGIDFNPVFRTPPSNAVAIPGPLNTIEGCSNISDRNGQIIFSTDGRNIYDRTGADITPLPNPPGLGGDPDATQSAIIVPVPGDETLYYIFTTQPIYGSNSELRYSLFDLKQGTNGQVIEYNKLLYAKTTERLTATGGWLIAHDYGNNTFRAYPISAAGIGNPVITNIGSDHSFTSAENGQGYMEIGNQNILAVTLSTPGVSNVVELFDFDTTTGILSNYRVADSKITSGQIYGIEFSGNKLLATIRNTPTSTLVEFALDSLKRPHLISPPAAPINGELGAIQMGPDNQMYVAINNSSSLGIITVNADTTLTSTVNTSGFPLNGGTSKLGLPNFIQVLGNPAQGPSIGVTGLCFGSPTDFTGSGTDNIDTLTWFFGDGSSVKGVNMTQASHTYALPGKYKVVLRISNRCVGFIQDLSQDIEIFNVPPDPSTTVVLCSTAQPLNANPSNTSGLTYLWSTSDTTKILTVNQTGNFTVGITNVNGCTTTGAFDVVSPLPEPINLGQDSAVCSLPGAGKVLNTNINLPNHTWTLNGAPIAGNNSSSQFADFAVPGLFKYKVVFTNPFNGCQSADSVTYSVKQSPVYNTVPTNLSGCGSNDGQIAITVTQPATNIFSYVVAPGGSGSNIDPNVVTPVTGLAAGAHIVTVVDMVTTCYTNSVVSLTDNAFTVGTTRNGTCDPNLKINITATPTAGPAIPNFTYRIIDNTTAQVVDPGGLIANGSPNLIALPGNNTYVVEVTSGTCVNSSTPFVLTPDPTLVVTFDPTNLCTTGTLTAVASPVIGGTTFDWTASTPNSFVSDPGSGATAQINSSPTPWNIVVTASGAGICSGTGTTQVTVDNIVPDFTASTCVNPVVLTATPQGSYIYDWYNLGPPTTQLTGNQQVTATTSGRYQLYVQSLLSGCPAIGPVEHDIDINLLGELTVSLSPVNNGVMPCKGTPFELNANTNRPVTSYTWTLNTKSIPNSSNINPLTGNTADGNYMVVVSDGTCSATDNVSIGLAPSSSGNLTSQALICPESTETIFNQVKLTPGNEFSNYKWFENDTEIVNYTDSTYIALRPGLYKVQFVNDFGCLSTDVADVIEQCDPKITAPTAFRPSSAVAPNTHFNVFTVFVADEDFQIFIFNRWGEMVYQSNKRLFEWDGSYNGTGVPLPPGTYAYVVKYKSSFRPEEGIKEKHGGVMLMR